MTSTVHTLAIVAPIIFVTILILAITAFFKKFPGYGTNENFDAIPASFKSLLLSATMFFGSMIAMDRNPSDPDWGHLIMLLAIVTFFILIFDPKVRKDFSKMFSGAGKGNNIEDIATGCILPFFGVFIFSVVLGPVVWIRETYKSIVFFFVGLKNAPNNIESFDNPSNVEGPQSDTQEAPQSNAMKEPMKGKTQIDYEDFLFKDRAGKIIEFKVLYPSENSLIVALKTDESTEVEVSSDGLISNLDSYVMDDIIKLRYDPSSAIRWCEKKDTDESFDANKNSEGSIMPDVDDFLK